MAEAVPTGVGVAAGRMRQLAGMAAAGPLAVEVGSYVCPLRYGVFRTIPEYRVSENWVPVCGVETEGWTKHDVGMALRGSDYVERVADLCRLLRTYRILAGMTQADLAKALGIAQTKVSKIELRERRLDLIEMDAYLRPLGKTLIDLAEDMELLRQRANVGITDHSLTLVATDATVTESDLVDAIDAEASACGADFQVLQAVGRADDVNGMPSWGVEFDLMPVKARDAIREALNDDARWEAL